MTIHRNLLIDDYPHDIYEFCGHDWLGFNGAESWDQTTLPVIRDCNDRLIVADKNAVEVFDTDERRYRLNIGFPTQKAAAAFIAGLPEDFAPAEFGFESDEDTAP